MLLGCSFHHLCPKTFCHRDIFMFVDLILEPFEILSFGTKACGEIKVWSLFVCKRVLFSTHGAGSFRFSVWIDIFLMDHSHQGARNDSEPRNQLLSR